MPLRLRCLQLPFFYLLAGVVPELPKCEGGDWWPVAFSNLLVSSDSCAHAPVAEALAASVLLLF